MSTRADRLDRHREGRRRRLCLVAGIVTLVLAGAVVASAATSQVDTLFGCVDDSTGGVVQVGGYPVWAAYAHTCGASAQPFTIARGGVAPTTTTTVPATTTTPTTQPATTTTRPPNSSGPPAAGGYFALLPPGSPFPTGAQCAARVHRSTWEPRHDNDTANHTTVTNTLATFGQWSAVWNANYRTRIDGAFAGTTDEIIQWAACKWGWGDDLIRAEAISESTWHQSTVGDAGTSYGLLQIRYLYHPRVNGGCKACAGSSWPNSERSTAWNVDQFAAEIRGCYDGMSTYLGNTRGDLWGCVQSWFSGAWTAGGGAYAQGVQAHLAAKPWRGWAG